MDFSIKWFCWPQALSFTLDPPFPTRLTRGSSSTAPKFIDAKILNDSFGYVYNKLGYGQIAIDGLCYKRN